MSDLFNHFKGLSFQNPFHPSIAEKIEEISIDEKQREQISVIFDMGFEMGSAFGSSGTKRDDPGYQDVRRMYIQAAGPEMVRLFNEIMREYEAKS